MNDLTDRLLATTDPAQRLTLLRAALLTRWKAQLEERATYWAAEGLALLEANGGDVEELASILNSDVLISPAWEIDAAT